MRTRTRTRTRTSEIDGAPMGTEVKKKQESNMVIQNSSCRGRVMKLEIKGFTRIAQSRSAKPRIVPFESFGSLGMTIMITIITGNTIVVEE